MGDDNLSFFITYNRECSSEELEVPKLFVSRFLSSVPENFILKSSRGFSNVEVRKTGKSVFFSGGWPSFVQNNNVLEGDFLFFRIKGGSCFIVKIFGLHACRKDADLSVNSGAKGNIWVTSRSPTRSRGSGGGGVSPLIHPKEELQSSSEEEGSRGYGGGPRRMGKAPLSIMEDDSRGGGRRIRIEKRHLSNGGEGLKAGVLRIPRVATRFDSQPRNRGSGGGASERLHTKEELRSSSEEEGHGGYSGAVQRMRRASLSPLEDDSSDDGSRGGGRKIQRSRTPTRHLSSGRHGPKPGTLRSNRVPIKLTPQPWAKNHNSGGGLSSLLRPKEELQIRFEEEGQDGYGGGARRMRRAPLSITEDGSTDDDSRGGGRRIRMERTLPRHLSSGGNGSKAGGLRFPRAGTRFDSQPRNRGSGPERLRTKEEGHGGYSGAVQQMKRASLSPSENDSSDDGSRGGGRKIRRSRTPTRHLSSGRHGPKPGALGIHMATTRLAPQSQVKSRGGTSAQFHPKEEQQSSSEENWLRWLSWRRSVTGKTSSSGLKHDSSDDGSRGSGGRIQTRTPPRRLSSGRDGPKTGVSRIHRATARLDPVYRPKEELQSTWEEEGQGGYLRTGRASIPGLKEDRSGDVSQGGRGRIRKRKSLKCRQEWR